MTNNRAEKIARDALRVRGHIYTSEHARAIVELMNRIGAEYTGQTAKPVTVTDMIAVLEAIATEMIEEQG